MKDVRFRDNTKLLQQPLSEFYLFNLHAVFVTFWPEKVVALILVSNTYPRYLTFFYIL